MKYFIWRSRMFFLVCAVVFVAVPAKALLFTPIEINGRLILVVHDCGAWAGDVSRKGSDGKIACKESESEFFRGDDGTFEQVVLIQELRKRPYDEVWLISGAETSRLALESAGLCEDTG